MEVTYCDACGDITSANKHRVLIDRQHGFDLCSKCSIKLESWLKRRGHLLESPTSEVNADA